eukprot:GHRQ01028842.1.p3 GENE.GHRQ01028842.1~~GHRQ01028842.1.p3  ORF type:complete len:154 (+),score=11.14 GHRQ01028842.1:162-623(+)
MSSQCLKATLSVPLRPPSIAGAAAPPPPLPQGWLTPQAYVPEVWQLASRDRCSHQLASHLLVPGVAQVQHPVAAGVAGAEEAPRAQPLQQVGLLQALQSRDGAQTAHEQQVGCAPCAYAVADLCLPSLPRCCPDAWHTASVLCWQSMACLNVA